METRDINTLRSPHRLKQRSNSHLAAKWARGVALVTAAATLVAGCGQTAPTLPPKVWDRVLPTANRQADNEGPKDAKAGAAVPPHSYHVRLSGFAATRVVARTPSMTALVTLRPKSGQVCWRFDSPPLTTRRSVAFGAVRARLSPVLVSIHEGAARFRGPLVAVLGPKYSQAGCGPAARIVVDGILAAHRLYYVTVATAQAPRGALRGQL